MTPALQILQGDALEKLRWLPSDSVHCCVTSPPYWGLRDYKTPGQIGMEKTPELWVARLVEVFREVRRVLHPSGTLWLNCGDAYAGGKAKEYNSNGYSDPGWNNSQSRKPPDNLKPKDMIGLPWLLAFALRADGWYLRSEITWAKKAPMPESVTDRPSNATEKIFLLSKSPDYFYDGEAVRQPYSEATLPEIGQDYRGESLPGWKESGAQSPSDTKRRIIAGLERNGGANLRNFWLLGPEPTNAILGPDGKPLKHYASFPSELPRRCILAGTSARGVCPACLEPWFRLVEKTGGTIGKGAWADHDLDDEQGKSQRTGSRADGSDKDGTYQVRTIGWAAGCKCEAGEPIPATVLDCFAGTFTSCAVALELGRSAIGIELSHDYIQLAKQRLGAVTPGLAIY